MRVYVEPLLWDDVLRMKKIAFDRFQKTGDYAPYMLIINGIYSAFRRNDLLKFKWSTYEITEENGSYKGKIVLVESKTKKKREVPMAEDYLQAVMYMMKVLKRPMNEFVHKSTYKSATSKVVNKETAYRWVKQIAKKAGIEQNVAMHSLRKAWALQIYTILGKNEDALVKVSTALNHRDTFMTRTYLGLSLNSEAINQLYLML